MKAAFPALLVATLALPAHADIFQCVVNGVKTFSQQPCGEKAETVSVSNAVRKITIPEKIDAASAEQVCDLMTGAWDMAAARSRNTSKGHIDTDSHRFTKDNTYVDRQALSDQVMGYMKERIANYDDLSKNRPRMLAALTFSSAIMVGIATRQPNMDSAAVRNFKTTCVNRFVE